MDFKQSFIAEYTDFELYLEGIKTSFSAVNIYESEASPPNLAINLPANSGALRILPGTIVHLYGPAKNPFKSVTEKVLLFEGEVTGNSFAKSSGQSTITLNCQSLLAKLYSAQAWPADALIYAKYAEAAGQPTYVLNDRDMPKQVTNSQINNQPTSSNGRLNDAPTKVAPAELGELTNTFGFKKALSDQLGEGSDMHSGNFQTFLEKVMEYFEGRDTTFGVSSRSFKLKNSALALPNKTNSTAFKNELLLETLNGFKIQLNNNKLYLMQAIQQLLRTMRYKLIMPASFTKTSQNFAKKTGSETSPLRLFMLPELDNAPPALCNVFFPEQIREFNYSRNANSEPTRMVGSMKFNLFVDSNINNTGIYPFKVVPNLDIGSDGYGGYTTEETYRGIRSALADLPAAFITTLEKSLASADSDEKINVDNLKEKAPVYAHMTEFILKEYLKQRFAGRQMTASCE